MNRALLLAAVLFPAAVLAQSAPQRPMPTYDDGEPDAPGGYQDSTSTVGMAHRQVAQPAGSAPREGHDSDGYDNHDVPPPPPSDGWRTPRPYPHENQVDDGRPDDAAHRADRNRTAALNHRTWPGYNAPTPGAATGSYAASHAQYQAELDRYARDMQRYHAEQARYSDRMTHWQAQTDACEHGYDQACAAPQ